jgi:hypothetical protein
MLVLKILGAVAALLLGVWLGLPGRYDYDPEELEQALVEGGHERARATRHFMAVDWFFRKLTRSAHRQPRRRFRTVAPDRRHD